MIEGAYALGVFDLGQGMAAPYRARLLAMHGAEVVEAEPPGGDWSRGLGKRYADHTAMSAHFNRGKKGLAVDLRAPAGRNVARGAGQACRHRHRKVSPRRRDSPRT
jgi:crotonobetainyl-CoA:carnitine CoA-transferase CaiB-like acyl-CoA transferase